MITRNNGFAWTVLVDGVNYKIETNTLDNEEAFKEAIFLKTGARWWSESAIKRYRSSHETKIIGRPVKLNRKARCIANSNV